MQQDARFGADGPRVAALQDSLSGIDRLGIAYSGGVDSATLLALAVRALGRSRVLAILGVSPSLAAAEREKAHEVAAFIGVPGRGGPHPRGGAARPTARTAPTAASTARTSCSRASTTRSSARIELDAVAYGENADDARRPDRPGSRAATEHERAAAPGRRQVWTRRRCGGSRAVLALPCADKPAAPCLASRIPHFEEVSPEKLAQVEAAGGRAARLWGSETVGCATTATSHGSSCRAEELHGPWRRAMREQVDAAVRSCRIPFRRGRPRRDPVRGVHAPAGGGERVADDWPGSRTLQLRRHRRPRPGPGGAPRLPRGRLLRGQDAGAGRAPSPRQLRRSRGAHPLHPGRRPSTPQAVLAALPDAVHAEDGAAAGLAGRAARAERWARCSSSRPARPTCPSPARRC